jgi:hypothetical protein
MDKDKLAVEDTAWMLQMIDRSRNRFLESIELKFAEEEVDIIPNHREQDDL